MSEESAMRDHRHDKASTAKARAHADTPSIDETFTIALGSTKLALSGQKMVLVLIIAAVLLPAAKYSATLSAPKPVELITAICIAVFSSLLCLWLMSVAGLIELPGAWLSRSIGGTAVASILATSAGAYQGVFSDRKFPLEGGWQVTVSDKDGTVLARRQAVLIHSESADTYWGYSDVDEPTENSTDHWLEIVGLNIDAGAISIRLLSRDMKATEFTAPIRLVKKQIVPIGSESKYQVAMSRSR